MTAKTHNTRCPSGCVMVSEKSEKQVVVSVPHNAYGLWEVRCCSLGPDDIKAGWSDF